MTVTDAVDPLSPYTVSFTALATIPESLSATKLIYGSVYQTASKTLNITVTNKASSGPITLTGTSIGGANAGDFAVTGGSCTGTLAASSSCTYAVTFTPSTETAESGTLSIAVAEDPNGGPPAVSLSGTGLSPLKALPPAGITFGTIVGGHSSANKTVTVYNYGAAAVTLSEGISGTNSDRLRGDGRDLHHAARRIAGGRQCALHLPAEVHAKHRRRGERDARGQRVRRCGESAQREPDGHRHVTGYPNPDNETAGAN